VTTHPLHQPQPPLSHDADAAAHYEIEPTGLNRHNDPTTLDPLPARAEVSGREEYVTRLCGHSSNGSMEERALSQESVSS
jgi:hypothetical protein